MKSVAIIPARYASTRFPGKPLVQIKGKPMVQHVYERCTEIFELVIVATDDNRIFDCVQGFGGKAVMTSPNHASGTDRVAEAANIIAKDFDFDIVVNVQGDEPFIEQQQLKQIIACFNDQQTDIATLVTPINSSEILFDPNKVKAVLSASEFALYFSRQAIPYQRDAKKEEWLTNQEYYLHLGLYAYRANVLKELTKLAPSKLENLEKLEQLRWLENGYRIKTAKTLHVSFGIDTPEDLENLEKLS